MNTTTSHAVAVSKPAPAPLFPALVGAIRPSARVPAIAFDAACVLLGSLFIAVCAQASVNLGFSPVPITGQTFAVLLIGAVLGPRLGAAACLAYLLEGLAGLPVFSPTAKGIATLGYIIGFIPAAWIVGTLCAKGWDRRPWTAAAAMTLALIPIFAIGFAWLAFFAPLNLAFMDGVLKCLPGEAIKVAAAALLIPSARAAVDMFRGV